MRPADRGPRTFGGGQGRAPGGPPGRPGGPKGAVPVARRVPAAAGPGGPGVKGGAGGKGGQGETGGPGANGSTGVNGSGGGSTAGIAAADRGSAPRTPQQKPSAPATEGPSPVAAMTAATSAALASSRAATVSAARALSGRLSEWSTTTRDRARDAVDDVRARREQAAASRSVARGQDSAGPAGGDQAGAGTATAQPGSAPTGARTGSGATVLGRERDGIEPPIPLLPASAAEPLSRDQSRMAIGIIVGFLVLAMLLAMWGLSRIPSLPTLTSPDDGEPAATATPTPGATDGATEGAEDGGSDGGDAPAAGQLAIAAVSDYDPLGDGAERPEELELILDGDESTFWGSEGYRSSEFSGLKSGLGVILDLGESASVREITLELPSESSGTLHVTDDQGYADGNELGDLAAAGSFSGDGSVTVTLEQPVTGRYVIVWFTEISDGGEQWYRARLAGATVTS